MAERHVVFFAEFIGKAVAFHAKPRLQRIFRVINAGVVDAAVARARRHAQLGKLLDKKNILPAFRGGVGDCTSNYAAADDQYVGLVHEFRISKNTVQGVGALVAT